MSTIWSGKTRLALLAPIAAALPLLATISASAGDSGKLELNGKVASTDVRSISGTAYVKISDMAKALGLVVVRGKDGAYQLVKPGGAGQIEGGVKGKIGDQLFDGQWRVKVLSVDPPVDSYTLKTPGEPYPYNAPVSYNGATRTLQAKPGYTLIVVHCRLANGQSTKQTMWIASGDSNTALTDTKGESYTPVAHDIDGAPNQTKPMLPGSAIDMPIVFAVPQNATLQDMVLTLRNNDGKKGTDARISLTP